jgi:phosphoribosylamine--glycine ligase
MKVLVIGSGGREHALCWAISKSPKCDELYCAPGNAGIEQVAITIPIAVSDLSGILDFVKKNSISFVVVGPEGPLVDGLIDHLEELGVLAFGPNALAAEFEGSKGLTKDLCDRYNIPTADYARFNEPIAAKDYIRINGAPIVIKVDGLAAGKGVFICRNVNQAYAAIDKIMTKFEFGEAGSEVVIEELLVGEEASFFALADGKTVLPLVPAQDHKAAFDGDKGPNTGGMGAYCPAPSVTGEMVDRIMNEIITPTIHGAAADGRPFKGVLFAGIMITKEGPKLIEYNVRFGDPECQPIMMRLKSDALELLLSCAEGRLDQYNIEWHDSAALCVVMAAEGYPGSYENGTEIRGLDAAGNEKDVIIFHAGTLRNNDRILSNGGRVLGVTALGKTVKAAKNKAYNAVNLIDWPEGFCRKDIGWRAAED